MSALGEWINDNKLDAATLVGCVVASVASVAGLVSQAVLNVSVLAVLAVVLVHVGRLARQLDGEAIATTVTDRIEAAMPKVASTRVVDDPVALYRDLTRRVSAANPARPSSRVIKIGSVRRTATGASTSRKTNDFIAACLDRVGEGWRVYRIVTIESVERLEQELARAVPSTDEGAYQLKILVGDYPTTLAPLVIGDEFAALGAQHVHRPGVERALVSEDPSAIEFMALHFDRQWELPDAKLLIDGGRVNSDAEKWARAKLRAAAGLV